MPSPTSPPVTFPFAPATWTRRENSGERQNIKAGSRQQKERTAGYKIETRNASKYKHVRSRQAFLFLPFLASCSRGQSGACRSSRSSPLSTTLLQKIGSSLELYRSAQSDASDRLQPGLLQAELLSYVPRTSSVLLCYAAQYSVQISGTARRMDGGDDVCQILPGSLPVQVEERAAWIVP